MRPSSLSSASSALATARTPASKVRPDGPELAADLAPADRPPPTYARELKSIVTRQDLLTESMILACLLSAPQQPRTEWTLSTTSLWSIK